MGYSHINPFVNSLMGFPGSIEVAFPNTEAQLCILHMAGGSLCSLLLGRIVRRLLPT